MTEAVWVHETLLYPWNKYALSQVGICYLQLEEFKRGNRGFLEIEHLYLKNKLISYDRAFICLKCVWFHMWQKYRFCLILFESAKILYFHCQQYFVGNILEPFKNIWSFRMCDIVCCCLLFLMNLFIFYLFYFWLCWVFVAAHGLSLVVASGVYSSLWCAGFSLRWLLLLRSMGSRCAGFSSCGMQAQ